MHELSIAQNLPDIVSGQCLNKGFKGIGFVNIRVGRASGIMPDALNFLPLWSTAGEVRIFCSNVRLSRSLLSGKQQLKEE